MRYFHLCLLSIYLKSSKEWKTGNLRVPNVNWEITFFKHWGFCIRFDISYWNIFFGYFWQLPLLWSRNCDIIKRGRKSTTFLKCYSVVLTISAPLCLSMVTFKLSTKKMVGIISCFIGKWERIPVISHRFNITSSCTVSISHVLP